ncbi:MAG: type III secretion inner membrane ring lipoprotein SctJ [Pseudomonadota bacterium]
MLNRRPFAIIASFLALLFLSACQEELYTNLDEREANEMLALLLRHGIQASKTVVKDADVTLNVEAGDIAGAVELLRTYGFPREQFDTVGTVFQKQGLVSSPTEDHIRLVYALSQGLNDTLSRIDGVLSARVHVVMPQQSTSLNAQTEPSSAAVFIRYQDSYDIAQLVAQIKTLVANSINGLTYDNVSVALFPVKIALPTLQDDSYDQILNLKVAPSSREPLLFMLAGLGALCIVLLGACISLFLTGRRRGTALQEHGGGT